MNQTKSLGSLPIDPAAEAATPALNGSGNDENAFFATGQQHFRLQHNQQNLGWLGKSWGATDRAAPTNIAGFVIAISALLIVGSFFMQESPELNEARKWLYGLTTSALGFVFGSATKK
ncbi:hypothetical protein HX857_28640 [Pseudomonas gingeri]|uniref:hypothetical protein n=1 Tax=Pseudomonas gingeri TaxID=117681 RepID=UPI0015B8A07C|nr:hypothetical protein [Pseudomonas gingeri]NWE72682.1 hypothetical protein [Pseudomonas gingeri]